MLNKSGRSKKRKMNVQLVPSQQHRQQPIVYCLATALDLLQRFDQVDAVSSNDLASQCQSTGAMSVE